MVQSYDKFLIWWLACIKGRKQKLKVSGSQFTLRLPARLSARQDDSGGNDKVGQVVEM